MKILKTAATLCGLALLGVVLAPSARADEWDQKSVITFSAPVEIPGVHLAGWAVLPAGTYVFKVLDSQSDRHIVQISDKEETTVYATILAIPNYRLQATGKTVMTFRERPAGEPEALRAWFYPGKNFGQEFVYGKAKAIDLAKSTNTPVLFTPTEMTAEVAEPIKSDAPVVMEMKRMEILAIQPTGQEVQLAEVVSAPPALVAAAQSSDRRMDASPAPEAPAQEPARLPATASDLPLIELLGLASLGGAFAVRAIAKRLT